MHRKRNLIHSLITRKRVHLTPTNYLNRIKSILFVLCVLVISTIALLLYSYGITYFTLGAGGALGLSMLLAIRYAYKRLNCTSIKGDSLIIQGMNNRSHVMGLSSVKKVQSKVIFGIHFTKLRYILDGRTNTTLIVNRCGYLQTLPESLIKKAIQLKGVNNEKKANHKPGSVFTLQEA